MQIWRYSAFRLRQFVTNLYHQLSYFSPYYATKDWSIRVSMDSVPLVYHGSWADSSHRESKNTNAGASCTGVVQES